MPFFSVNKLDNLAQIKGQTWRSASFWHRDFLKNTGATPTTSRWGQETYDKLANGEMHGLMVNIDSAIDIKAYEHTPYALVSKQMWLGHIYPVVISLDRWNSLNEQDRKAFERAAEKSYGELGAIMDSNYTEMLKKARSLGVTVRELSDDEVRQWGKTSQYLQVQQNWANAKEQEGVANVQSVLEKLRNHIGEVRRSNYLKTLLQNLFKK